MELVGVLVSVISVSIVLLAWRPQFVKFSRERFLKTYVIPASIFEQISLKYSVLDSDDFERIDYVFRQYFQFHQDSGHDRIGVPSRLFADFWLLFSKNPGYDKFCAKAFGFWVGPRPAILAFAPGSQEEELLKRAWWHCCLYEGIVRGRPLHVPTLFALDEEVGLGGSTTVTFDYPDQPDFVS